MTDDGRRTTDERRRSTVIRHPSVVGGRRSAVGGRRSALSGMPDNVTDEGVIVGIDAGRRLQSEKQLLRATIVDLGAKDQPDEVRGLARLAAGNLIAGDVETARRYITHALELHPR